MLTLLTKGAYGDIFTDRYGNVCKRVESSEDAMQEIEALKGIHHPNVIALNSWNNDDMYIEMFFDRYDMDLFQFINTKHDININNSLLYDIAIQITRGIDAIHKAGFMHRDIKTENILINVGDIISVVITDFGWATRYIFGRQNTLPNEMRFIHPPEILCGETRYTQSVDIFAYGMLLFELLNEENVYSGFAQTLTHGKKLDSLYLLTERLRYKSFGKRFDRWKMTQQVYDLWRECIHQDPNLRPPAERICSILQSFIK